MAAPASEVATSGPRPVHLGIVRFPRLPLRNRDERLRRERESDAQGTRALDRGPSNTLDELRADVRAFGRHTTSRGWAVASPASAPRPRPNLPRFSAFSPPAGHRRSAPSDFLGLPFEVGAAPEWRGTVGEASSFHPTTTMSLRCVSSRTTAGLTSSSRNWPRRTRSRARIANSTRQPPRSPRPQAGAAREEAPAPDSTGHPARDQRRRRSPVARDPHRLGQDRDDDAEPYRQERQVLPQGSRANTRGVEPLGATQAGRAGALPGRLEDRHRARRRRVRGAFREVGQPPRGRGQVAAPA